MKKLIIGLFSLGFLSLNACSQNSNVIIPEINKVDASAKKDVTTLATLDNPPFINQGVEFSAIATMSDGKIIKYQTFKAGKVPTTIVYQSKWIVIESHQTTGTEANTILKLLSQNGYAKEYKTLQERYESSGLVRK